MIDAAHRLGYHVTTTGNRPGDLGHAHADGWVDTDFSDREAIRSLAARLEVSGIVSGCNDFASLSTAYAAEALGLPGHDSHANALRIHHKDRFRHLLTELKLPTPRSAVARSLDDAREICTQVGFPCIVKPVDLTGGKGISKCGTLDELAGAFESGMALTRESYLVVEQFLVGTHHGFTCFVTAGRVGFWFADDEQYFRNPYLVSGTTTPTSMPPSAIEELINAVELIAAHLDLVDGLMHVQCINTADGPRITELCRRCPGDLYPDFVRLSTGFDYANAVVSAELGLPIEGSHPQQAGRYITRHCLMATREGVLQGISLNAELQQHRIGEMLWWTAGQEVTNHLSDKFGIVFFGFDTAAQMRATTRDLPDRILIDIVDPGQKSLR